MASQKLMAFSRRNVWRDELPENRSPYDCGEVSFARNGRSFLRVSGRIDSRTNGFSEARKSFVFEFGVKSKTCKSFVLMGEIDKSVCNMFIVNEMRKKRENRCLFLGQSPVEIRADLVLMEGLGRGISSVDNSIVRVEVETICKVWRGSCGNRLRVTNVVVNGDLIELQNLRWCDAVREGAAANSQNVCILFARLHYSVNGSVRPRHLHIIGRRARADRLSQTVFVLEDDTDIARLVQHHLEAAGFTTRLFHTPTNLIPDAERQPPALFLLDIMVPGGDGLDVCRRLRNNASLSTIPIIFLTARAGENDRVLGLELGADDYITKPFATRELVARVKAVLRRFERPTTPSIISFEEVIIDANAMQLQVRGEHTTTTATEFRLLDYLARHPGRVFSRDHLLDAVWGDARFVTPRSVDVYVRRIREKIEVDAENPRYLKTVRGAGYRFELPKGE